MLFRSFVAVPKGEPENFLSAAELRAKFDSLLGPCLAPAAIDRLAEGLDALDDADDIAGVLRLTRGGPATPLKAAAGED